MIDYKRLSITNKLLPILTGLSADLLFWIAISSLYLANVKGFTAAQITFLSSCGALVSIFSIIFADKIIKKIGNFNSFRLGLLMLLVASVLLTVSNNYYLFILAYCLYYGASLFKGMDSVILKNNLECENRGNEYLHLRSNATLVYSVATMFISFIASTIYNISPYLPMFFCVGICLFNFIASNFVYCAPINNENNSNSAKLKINTIIIFVFLSCIISFPIIDSGMSQERLVLQYRLNNLFNETDVANKLFFVLALSRVIRTIGSFIFTRANKKHNTYSFLPVIAILSVISFSLVIIGNYLSNTTLMLSFNALGYFIFIAIRDAYSNMCNSIIITSCNKDAQQQAILYYNVANKIGTFSLNLIITLLLLKLNIIYGIHLLLLLAIINLYILFKLYNLTKKA